MSERETLLEPKTLRANGYDFSCVEAGHGETLLFVHGSCLDHRYWHPWVQYFSTDYRAIAFSRRHHWPLVLTDDKACYTAKDQATDLISFIEADCAQPVHIVGHSYGGYLSALVACNRPDLLASMILIEPGGPVEGQDAGHSIEHAVRQAIQLLKEDDSDAAASVFFAAIDAQKSWAARAQDFKAMTLDNIATLLAQFKHARVPLAAEKLAACDIRTLLLLGENAVSPFPETAVRLAELMPNAECSRVPDASHMADLDNPQTFQALLNAFLARQT